MRTLLLAALLLAALPLAGALAPVSGTTILAGPGAWVTDFTTKAAAAMAGGEVQLINADLMHHDVVARRDFGDPERAWCGLFPTSECPVFWSPLAGTGDTVSVEGLDQVSALRTYEYYCTIHPQMRGTLVIVPQAG